MSLIFIVLIEEFIKYLSELRLSIHKNILYCRVYIAIKQFTEGLESVGGMWTLIKTNSEAFKDVFCYEDGRLTRTKFKNLYIVEYSERGSNNYQNEIDTVYAWEEYLLECESEHFLL